ncbi:MAG: 50S ribosomal protein L29 [Chloroflexia bacterium]
MKTEDLTNMSEADLKHNLEESRQELLNLRFQIATRKIKNHKRLPAVKKDIARIMTLLRERELMSIYAGVDFDEVAATTAAPATQATTRRRTLFGRGNK